MRGFAALCALVCACSALTPVTRSTDPAGFNLSYQGASGVQVVGDWNLWGGLEGPEGRFEPMTDAMTDTGDGEWYLAMPSGLPRGMYRYAFLVDGYRLLPDPMCSDRALWKGQEVSVLEVR